MKRNRRIKKQSRFTHGSVGVAVLIVTGLCGLMTYFSFDAKCATVSKAIGADERRLSRLEAELTRENVKWDELKTPERLDAALTRFGLEMRYPRESQLVRMTPSGVPEHGQASLVRRTAVVQNALKQPLPVAAVVPPKVQLRKDRKVPHARRR